MRLHGEPVELIVERASVSSKSMTQETISQKLVRSGIPVEEVREPQQAPVRKSARKAAVPAKKVFVRTGVKDTEVHPWDLAHLALDSLDGSAGFIEPDIYHEFIADPQRLQAKSGRTSPDCVDPDWPPAENRVWHLEDAFSGLKKAREAVNGLSSIVRIAHLDTGFNPAHPVVPESVKKHPLQRNFIAGENDHDARDPLTPGPFYHPGHGTATLGLLAGSKVRAGDFHDFLGGAPFADVFCCRLAPTVVLVKTSAFADALNYLTELSLNGTPVHIVSMSMGGAPSRNWADAVNEAYEAGITLVTAAGNNFGGLPTRHVVYPARFKRVIAACGVTHDFKPYFHPKPTEMQGCYGPRRHMEKALAAFTPNTPWAVSRDGEHLIAFSGAGTSSATPQIAAAAAIYYRKHHQQLDALKPWQRVEAIRNALYRSAKKTIHQDYEDHELYFGNGILQAAEALQIPVSFPDKKTPKDEVPWFPILNTIFKAVPDIRQQKKLELYNTELAQLVFDEPELSLIIGNEEKPFGKVKKEEWKLFAESVIHHPKASDALKNYLRKNYRSL